MDHASRFAAEHGRPILSLVVDRASCTLPWDEAIEAAVAGGVDWVQLRERGVESGELLEIGRRIASAIERGASGRRVDLIVNRRVDIALSLGANGVHLGFDAMPPAKASALLSRGGWIGCSTHAADEAEKCAAAGVDYVHLAPIFAPLSKPQSRPALGLDALERAASHGVPVFAQGGIEAHNCGDVIRRGAAGVAVTGAILQHEDPKAAASALRTALDA